MVLWGSRRFTERSTTFHVNFTRPNYHEPGRRSLGNAKGPFIFAGKCGWPGSLLTEADRDASDQPSALFSISIGVRSR